jgi:hypothetical protein
MILSVDSVLNPRKASAKVLLRIGNITMGVVVLAFVPGTRERSLRVGGAKHCGNTLVLEGW